jgi:hypothetical protein
MTNPRQVIRVIGDEPTPEDQRQHTDNQTGADRAQSTVFDMFIRGFSAAFPWKPSNFKREIDLLGKKQVTSHSRMVHFEAARL